MISMRSARPGMVIAIGMSLMLSAPTASAEITTQDVQIAARALSFLQKPMTGEISVGIVYARNNPQSLQEADNLQRLLGEGMTVGNITLKPTLLPLSDVAHAHFDLFFLTTGLATEAASVADVSRTLRIPCVTTDIAQVLAGRCALGVRSKPKVEIIVNRAAAMGNGTLFSTVFRMMITEL